MPKTVKQYSSSKKDRTFQRWYLDSSDKAKVKTISQGSTGDITLYTGWITNTYTVKFYGSIALSDFIGRNTKPNGSDASVRIRAQKF